MLKDLDKSKELDFFFFHISFIFKVRYPKWKPTNINSLERSEPFVVLPLRLQSLGTVVALGGQTGTQWSHT